MNSLVNDCDCPTDTLKIGTKKEDEKNWGGCPKCGRLPPTIVKQKIKNSLKISEQRNSSLRLMLL